MSDFLSILYNQFFLRDFLGKICPGGLIALCFALLLKTPEESLFEYIHLDSDSTILCALVISILWILGLGVQLIGLRLGIISMYPVIDNVDRRRASVDFRRRLLFFTTDSRITTRQRDQRERYVVLKEVCGNIATALLLVTIFVIPLIILQIDGATVRFDRIMLVYMSFCNFGLLYIFLTGHRHYRKKQADFEIDIFASYNPRNPRIRRMRRNVGRPEEIF